MLINNLLIIRKQIYIFLTYLYKKYMPLFNANYEIMPLSGTMTINELGDGITASTVHQILCVSNGKIQVTALGGGSFEWDSFKNDTLDILLSACTITSGEFVGFKSKFYNHQSRGAYLV